MTKCNSAFCGNEGILIAKFAGIKLAYCEDHLYRGKYIVKIIKNVKRGRQGIYIK